MLSSRRVRICLQSSVQKSRQLQMPFSTRCSWKAGKSREATYKCHHPIRQSSMYTTARSENMTYRILFKPRQTNTLRKLVFYTVCRTLSRSTAVVFWKLFVESAHYLRKKLLSHNPVEFDTNTQRQSPIWLQTCMRNRCSLSKYSQNWVCGSATFA